MYMYTHIYTHIHIYIYIYMCIYIHAHLSVCMIDAIPPASRPAPARSSPRPRLSSGARGADWECPKTTYTIIITIMIIITIIMMIIITIRVIAVFK